MIAGMNPVAAGIVIGLAITAVAILAVRAMPLLCAECASARRHQWWWCLPEHTRRGGRCRNKIDGRPCECKRR